MLQKKCVLKRCSAGLALLLVAFVPQAAVGADYRFPAYANDLPAGVYWRITGHNAPSKARDLSGVRFDKTTKTWTQWQSGAGKEKKNSDALIYGIPLYSMTGGEVVACWRRAPENTRPGRPHPGRAGCKEIADDEDEDFKRRRGLRQEGLQLHDSAVWKLSCRRGPRRAHHTLCASADGQHTRGPLRQDKAVRQRRDGQVRSVRLCSRGLHRAGRSPEDQGGPVHRPRWQRRCVERPPSAYAHQQEDWSADPCGNDVPRRPRATVGAREGAGRERLAASQRPASRHLAADDHLARQEVRLRGAVADVNEIGGAAASEKGTHEVPNVLYMPRDIAARNCAVAIGAAGGSANQCRRPAGSKRQLS